MELLQAGVDRAVIALWLGHESVETTQIYYVQTVDMCSSRSNILIAKRQRRGRLNIISRLSLAEPGSGKS